MIGEAEYWEEVRELQLCPTSHHFIITLACGTYFLQPFTFSHASYFFKEVKFKFNSIL